MSALGRRIGDMVLAGAARLAWRRSRQRRRRGRPAVVFLGDSITEFWLDLDPWFFLARDHVDAGISGETTAQMRARFEADVVASRPRVAHIMAGTNDLWHGQPGDGATDSLANLGAMVEQARAAGIAVILAQPPPIAVAARPLFAHLHLEAALRAGIAMLCRRQALVHLDYATSLAGADGEPLAAFTTDGVHLTRRGYLAMRAQARAALDLALRGAT